VIECKPQLGTKISRSSNQYWISNFGIGENGGNIPLLDHCYKLSFFKNTALKRVGIFDSNPRGFRFEHFGVFTSRKISEKELCDVIRTIVSIFDAIPFNYAGVDKIRRTVILEDFEHIQPLRLRADGHRKYTVLLQIPIPSVQPRPIVTDTKPILQAARIDFARYPIGIPNRNRSRPTLCRLFLENNRTSFEEFKRCADNLGKKCLKKMPRSSDGLANYPETEKEILFDIIRIPVDSDKALKALEIMNPLVERIRRERTTISKGDSRRNEKIG
ncbi:hypothetical protein Tco_0782091, partial [Tanacetum coccineum]